MLIKQLEEKSWANSPLWLAMTNLPEATSIIMKIYDVSGRILKVIEGDFSRGYNKVSIEKRDLSNSGVLYYQIDTPTNSDAKKMLMID